jgi:hypothetical protein
MIAFDYKQNLSRRKWRKNIPDLRIDNHGYNVKGLIPGIVLENQMSLVKNPSTGKVLELLGPTVEFLTSPEDPQNDFCVIRGTVPPGVSVPLPSHADTEDFLVISGELEGLRVDNQDHTWIKAKAIDYIHCSL